MTDTERGGIYSKSSKNWWLASPGPDNRHGVHVHGLSLNTDYVVDSNQANQSFAVRPLVCIPNSEFDITNMTTK